MERATKFSKTIQFSNFFWINELLTSIQFYVLLFLTLLLTTKSFAQTNNNRVSNSNISIDLDVNADNEVQKILEVKVFLQGLYEYELMHEMDYSIYDRVYSLLYDVQPSIYFFNNQINTYGEKPIAFFTDVPSLNSLNNPNLLIDNVDIVTININSQSDLTQYINLKAFYKFTKLKYVYIIGNTSITENAIKKMVINLDPKYSVFYKIPKSDNY
jgi:hypothetical protein